MGRLLTGATNLGRHWWHWICRVLYMRPLVLSGFDAEGDFHSDCPLSGATSWIKSLDLNLCTRGGKFHIPLISCNSTRFTFREKYAARLGWPHCHPCWLKATCVFYLPFKLELEWRSFPSLVHDQFFKVLIKFSSMLFYKCWQNTSRTLQRSENIVSSFHDFRDKFTR